MIVVLALLRAVLGLALGADRVELERGDDEIDVPF